ncbi:hypothetical protein KR067_005201 [Drosophila pandora]|nr:hypothetical protein KR067_005201 [Drosophila pandora]
MLGLRFSTLAICLSLSLQWIGPVDSKICQTHDNKVGKCKRPRDCPALQPILEKSRKRIPLTNEEQTLKTSVISCIKKKTFCCEEPINSTGLELLKENDNICGNFVDFMVFNGRNIRPGSRPWMALLEYNVSGPIRTQFKCGGTLITPGKSYGTLGICHSTFGFFTEVSVRLGEHDLSQPLDCMVFGNEKKCLDRPLDVPVENVKVHENYGDFYLLNDIALIRLRDPVQFTNWIRPICLPLSLDVQLDVQTGNTMEVVGWGRTEKNILSDVPKKAFVQRLQCGLDDATRICASADGTDSCLGDSGGPLAYATSYKGKQRMVQAGIVSYGIDRMSRCGQQPYAVYTAVVDFMAWITETIVKKW